MSQHYTNVLTPDLLASINTPRFTTAQIAGMNADARALVGSRFDNGDEIISTPQGSGFLVSQQGVPLPEDFLRVTGA